MHGFGEKGHGGDDGSLRSGLSGDTLTGEKKGRRGGELARRLLGRKGGEGAGDITK